MNKHSARVHCFDFRPVGRGKRKGDQAGAEGLLCPPAFYANSRYSIILLCEKSKKIAA